MPKCGTTHLVRKAGAGAQAVPSSAAPAPQPAPAMPWFASSPQAAGTTLVIIAHDSKVVAI